MTFARTGLACLTTALTLTLTACGGGGDTGPQWAQEVRRSTAELTSGTANPDVVYRKYAGACVDALLGLGLLSAKTYVYLESTSNPNQLILTKTLRYHGGADCDESNYELTYQIPSVVASVVGKVTLATGEQVFQLDAFRPNGAPVIKLGAATSNIDSATGEGVVTTSDGFGVAVEYLEGEVYRDALYLDDTQLVLGEKLDSGAYPEALNDDEVYTYVGNARIID